MAVDRRRFLQGAAVAAVPSVLGAGVAAAADRIIGGDEGLATAARSGPGLGVRNMIWGVDTTEPVVALTFDDGPDPAFTPSILDTLDRYGVHASFMLVGARVAASPDLVRRAVDAGHDIGNHTYDHPSLATLDHDQTRAQLERTAEIIDRTVPGTVVRWFRPPRGILTGAGAQAASSLGYDTVLWSSTRGPADVTDPARVAAYVDEHLVPGAVTLLHDSLGAAGFDGGSMADELRAKRKVEVRALPLILERALDRGVRFVTVSDLVASGDP